MTSDQVIHYGWVLPHWVYWGTLILFPLFFMFAYRRQQRKAEAEGRTLEVRTLAEGADESRSRAVNVDWVAPGNAFTRFADRISEFSGVFVSYWTVVAVLFYSYEVVARYGFNAPTNWAHEASFLMFGMMYVLCGAFGYLNKAHVRVDAVYALFSQRGRAAIDLVTWLFFLMFILVFIVTSWRFFAQALDRDVFFFALGYDNEKSMSEWRVDYAPIKFLMVVGGVLMLIQGIAGLIRDIQVFCHLGDAKNV